ncbi:MAG: hypothetical protein MUE81_15930 [Thermoflexibacter sp.]|nr:hypothetical protein [Thermoflexibacter sp.]
MKGKIASEHLLQFKKELLNLINELNLDKFFQRVESSQLEYSKGLYQLLKKEFIHGNIYDNMRVDYFDRLRAFVEDLELGKRKEDNHTLESVTIDKEFVLGAKKLKSIVNQLQFVKYTIYVLNILNSLVWIIYFVLYDNKQIYLFTTIALICLLTTLGFELIKVFLFKNGEKNYQYLIAQIAYFQSIPELSGDISISIAQNSIVKFANIEKSNFSFIYYAYLSSLMLLFALAIVISFFNNIRKEDSKQQQLVPKTYLYSPSFDSLLQNDKRVYQYVDSLIQKHKK